MYRVLKRHVPPGALIADCAAEQLYLGDEYYAAVDAAKGAKRDADPDAFTGVMVIDVYDGQERIGVETVQGNAHRPPWTPERRPGYPAHTCGKPMSPPSAVPALVVSHLGAPPNVKALYCAGCCLWVDASPDERLRALNAWAIERGP